MEFKPASEPYEAGLAIYMSNQFHYEIGETLRNKQCVVVLNKSVGDMQTSIISPPLADGTTGIWLKIDSDAKTYTFSYAEQEGQWKVLGTGSAKLISSELADVWSGACYGLYAAYNPRPAEISEFFSPIPADFDWFEYHAYPETFKEQF